MSKKIIAIIFFIFFSNNSKTEVKETNLCQNSQVFNLEQATKSGANGVFEHYRYDCNYDFWYMGRRTRGLSYHQNSESSKEGPSLTKIDFFSKRNPISDYHHYLAELSKITLVDKNGNLITNRKFKISADVRSVGLTKDYLPQGAKLRNDITTKENKFEIVVTLGADGQIIVPTIADFLNWKARSLIFYAFRKRHSQSEEVIQNVQNHTRDFNYHHLRMNILNGLTDTDISDDLKENYSIDAEVTDLGGTSSLQKLKENEEVALKIKEEELQRLEDKIILNGKNIADLLQGQEEFNKSTRPLKISQELLNFLEQGRRYNQQKYQIITERDHLVKSITVRKKLDSLGLKGQKIEMAKIDGEVLISDFMRTNREAFELPSYYANSKGLWVKVNQHRSIFGLKGILDTSIFDTKYNQRYQELMKE